MPRTRKLSTVPNAPGRALLYLRVSALMGRSGDDFHSPEVQLHAMRQTIAAAGLREVAVIDDDIDVTGRTFDRKGVARIRAMVEAGQVDVVAVYALSRIGRNLSESLTFVKWLRARGVSVISSQERIDDTPEGQFMVGMWLGMAELQSEQIGIGWARVIERRARLGKAHAGITPEGYRRVDGRLEPDPVLGPAMAKAFGAYAAGDPVSEIVRRYNTVRGRPIAKTNFKKLLHNPIYLGVVVVHSKTGGRIETRGEHAPLIDQAIWDRVLRRLAKDRTTPPRHLNPQHSLTGLLRCDACGNALQVTHSYEHGKDRPNPRVMCTRKQGVGDCPGIGHPLYAEVERAVLDMVTSYAERLRGNPVARQAQLRKAENAAADAGTLERELARTREAMTRLTERWARRAMNDRNYDTAMARLAEAEARQLDALAAAQDVSQAPDTGAVVVLIDQMLELWPRMTGGERNRVLKSVLRQVTVRRAEYWREPPYDCVMDPVFHW